VHATLTRTLGTGRSNKNNPNDARAVTLTALRHHDLREVRPEVGLCSQFGPRLRLRPPANPFRFEMSDRLPTCPISPDAALQSAAFLSTPT